MIIYETSDDRLREQQVADAVEKAWELQLLRLPRLSEAGDYIAVVEGKVFALVEIKRRNVDHDHYGTYMIATRKINLLLDTANSLRLEAVVVVEFTDGTYWVNAHELSRMPTRQGGRYDRPEENTSVEPTYHLPHKDLRRLGDERPATGVEGGDGQGAVGGIQ